MMDVDVGFAANVDVGIELLAVDHEIQGIDDRAIRRILKGHHAILNGT